jgi:hypothetical protein
MLGLQSQAMAQNRVGVILPQSQSRREIGEEERRKRGCSALFRGKTLPSPAPSDGLLGWRILIEFLRCNRTVPFGLGLSPTALF